MRFVGVRDLRGKSSDIWRDLSVEREMIVTRNGKPVAILAAVDESNLEELLAAFRRARAVDAAARMQRSAAERGAEAIGAEEIEREIAAVRRKRAE